jgi:hypothetical protein
VGVGVAGVEAVGEVGDMADEGWSLGLVDAEWAPEPESQPASSAPNTAATTAHLAGRRLPLALPTQ